MLIDKKTNIQYNFGGISLTAVCTSWQQ